MGKVAAISFGARAFLQEHFTEGDFVRIVDKSAAGAVVAGACQSLAIGSQIGETLPKLDNKTLTSRSELRARSLEANLSVAQPTRY